MNCEQFENRLQQLLDDRASLSLDLQIQKHSRECMDCRYALTVYECFSIVPPKDSDLLQPAASGAVRGPHKSAWKQRQQRVLRNRVMLAVAAMLFICLGLVARPPIPNPVAVLDMETVTAEEQVTPAFNSNSPLFGSLDLSSFFSNSFTGSLNATPYVDFASIGRIDLASWIPQEPVRVVQSIPATFETIEPIYRYSTDLPVLNHWSSGINYTIGLIQNSLPYPGPSQNTDGDDLGSKNPTSSLDQYLAGDGFEGTIWRNV